MIIMLNSLPIEIYLKYKRMCKYSKTENSIQILSELNNVTQAQMKEVIKQEEQKEKQLGLVPYIDSYRSDLVKLKNGQIDKICYEIKNTKKKKHKVDK